jgi:hypothetical protein
LENQANDDLSLLRRHTLSFLFRHEWLTNGPVVMPCGVPNRFRFRQFDGTAISEFADVVRDSAERLAQDPGDLIGRVDALVQ